MLRRLSALAALALCCSVGTVHALGLGDIRVKSGLSQRFSAVVPFVSLTSSEAENVRARMARVRQYADAGIERSDYLSSLDVEVITDDGNPRIEIRSSEIAREPLLNVMLEVRTAGGPRVLRNYAVFLDPPVQAEVVEKPAPATTSKEFFEAPQSPAQSAPPALESPSPAAPAPSPQPRPWVSGAEPVEVETAASLPAGGGEAVKLTPGRHGPVEAGEALWEIANFNAPPGVSQEQSMLAIYEANPQAFADQNINYLKTGVILNIPDAGVMKKVSQAAAVARLAELSKPIDQSQASLAAADRGPDAAVSAPAQPETASVDDAYSSAVANESMPASTASPSAPASTETPSGATDLAASDAGADPSVSSEETQAGTTSGSLTEAAGDALQAGQDPESSADSGSTAEPLDADPGSTPTAQESPPFRSVTEDYEAASDSAPDTSVPATAGDAGSRTSGAPLLGKLWVGLVAILALIAGLFGLSAFRKSRDARAQREYEEAMQQMQSGGGGAGAAAAAAVAKDREARSPREDLEQAERDLDEDATRLEDDDATRLDQEDITAPHPPAGQDDVATHLRQGTADVDLGDNDPVAEADFHLAYGLYDEAALMLQQAAEREPERSDIRVKLAETYFAAGNSAQFEKVAGSLKSELDAEEWSKIAIMGRQLCPGIALFGASEGTDAGGGLGVDLSLDEPSKPAGGDADDGLDFKLEELELPDDQGETIAAADPDGGLEFDLGDFDLEGKQAEEGATHLAGAGEVKPQDFDLAGSDLEAGAEESSLDVKLDEVDPDLLDDVVEEEAPEDDPGTKLDLARAYVEMGDSQMAGGLLDEVEASGDDEQKAEAAKLRQRLSEGG